MFAQRLLEGELYVTNSLVAPIIYELREHINAALAHHRGLVEINPQTAVSIEACLEKMLTAFEDRFGDGTNVIPVNSY